LEIVTEIRSGYAEVKFVNRIGQKGKRVGKPIPEELLKKLNNSFKGKAEDVAPVSPKGFFDNLPGVK